MGDSQTAVHNVAVRVPAQQIILNLRMQREELERAMCLSLQCKQHIYDSSLPPLDSSICLPDCGRFHTPAPCKSLSQCLEFAMGISSTECDTPYLNEMPFTLQLPGCHETCSSRTYDGLTCKHAASRYIQGVPIQCYLRYTFV